MDYFLLIPILFGFLIVLFFLPIWIKKAKLVGLAGKDMHKHSEEKVSEAGGISVLIGFVSGVLLYIAIKTFYFKTEANLVEIFSLLCVMLIVGIIGLMDDILGWKIGLNKKTRILLLIFASIPLVVINAGESQMAGIELGILYPLLMIPLGVIGASATFNFIAGYNGLESSQGILILSALGFILVKNNESWLSMIW